MRIRIQLFAAARQIAGRDDLGLDVADGATIADVRRAIIAAAPALDRIVAHVRWAVDAEFVGDDHRVTEQSEIALIPPVSGG
jgi:molybdopterin converting factor subunit 1